MARPLVIPILGNTVDLESALERAGIVAEDASKKITGSFRSAGLAAAQEAAKIGSSVDEQAAAAGRAAAAFTEMSAKITTAQRNAGKAAAAAAGAVGASVDEQRAAYTKAIATQSEYEASQQRMADAAKRSADEQAAAARRAAAAAKAAAAEQTKAAAAIAAAHDRAIGQGSKTLQTLGKGTLLGGVGAAAASVYGGAKLQSQMERLHTQAGASQQQVGQLTSGVLNMAGSVGTTPDQLSQGMYHVVSSLNATVPAAQRASVEMNVLKLAAEGAKVGGSNLVDTTNALDAAVVSGIKGVQNYSQAMGAMNATVGAGDMSMQDLSDAFGTGVVVQAKEAGVSINQLGGALAVLGDNNIRGARAGTLMASSLRIMKAPSEAAAQALGAIGLSSTSLAQALRSGGIVGALQDLKTHLRDSGANANQTGLILTRAFGGRQSAGIQDLIGQFDRLKDKTKQVADGGKNFGKDYAGWSQTLAGQMDKLKATVESLGDKFGMYLIPKLEAAGQAIQGVVGWLEKHQAAAEQLAMVIGNVLGVAVAAYAYSKATAFVNATKAMVSGMAGLARGAGAAATAVATKLGIIGSTSEATEAEVAAANAGMVASTEEMEVGVVGAADGAAAGVDAAIGSTGIGLVLIAAGVGVEELATHWSTAMHGIEAAVNAMVKAAETALNGLISALNGAIKLLDKIHVHIPSWVPGVGGDNFGFHIGQVGKVGVHDVFGGGSNASGSGLVGGAGNLGRGSTHSSAAGAAATRSGSYNQVSFATATLAALGITPTAANIRDFTAWEQQEGGNWNNTAKYNPLNTTQTEQGSRSAGLQQKNIQAYKSWAQGIAATTKTIQGYSAIIAALKQGVSVSQFSRVLQTATLAGTDSHWGTGAINTSGVTVPSASLKKYLNATSGTSAAKKAAAVSTIPVAVATMLKTAEALIGTHYSPAGDHGNGFDSIAELKKIGIDCSGFVSAVLHSGGVKMPLPQTTQGLPSYLEKGNGKDVTVYDRHTGPVADEHTIIDILGHYFESGGNSKFNPSGGVSMLTAKQAAGELAGGGFEAFHPKYSGKLATDKELKAMGLGGISGSGSATSAATAVASLTQAIQALKKAAASAGLTLISRFSSAAQNGSITSLQRDVGWGGGWGGHWSNNYGRYSAMASQMTTHPSQMVAAVQGLGNNASMKQIQKRLLPGVEHETRGTAANTEYQQRVEALVASGQDKEAKQLVAAHERAMKALAQELYAAQVTKNAQEQDLQNTELQDQTTAIQNAASNAQQILSAQAQKITDKWDAATTSVKDAAQVMSDQMQGIAQSIKDQTTIASDQSGGVVDAMNDQTQTLVDQIGERGLYGLNLIAQQQTVQLDEMKAGYDQQIDYAQQQLDVMQAQANAAENAAQINVDQVTAAEDMLVSQAQNNLDTVTIGQDQRIATAQAHADSVQAHADATIIGPAQIAVDLGATLPKAQQDVLNAQLAAATSQAGKLTNQAQLAYEQTYASAEGNIGSAQQSYNSVQGSSQLAIQKAQNTLQSVTDYFNVLLAQSQQSLTSIQNNANQAEAAQQGKISLTQAEASTQFAGTGTTINIYGTDTSNATGVANEVSWALRTALAPA